MNTTLTAKPETLDDQPAEVVIHVIAGCGLVGFLVKTFIL